MSKLNKNQIKELDYNQLSDYIVPDSVTGTDITITTISDDISRILLNIQTAVEGGDITINRNGNGALNLKYPNGKNVTSLQVDEKYFEILDLGTHFELVGQGSFDPTTHEQTAGIQYFPAGTIGDNVDEFKAQGLSVINGVVNGDFSNGVVGWTSPSGTLTNVAGECNYNIDSFNSLARIQQENDNTIPTSKYFLFGEINPLYSNNTYMAIGNSDSPTFNPTPNVWNEIYSLVTAADNTRLQFYHRTDSNYSINDDILFDNVFGIYMGQVGSGGLYDRLEALGLTTDAEKESFMLYLVRNGYFEGLTDLEGLQLDIEGKNAFNYSISEEISIGQGLAIALPDNIICNSNLVWDSFQFYLENSSLKIGEQYTFSAYQNVISGNNRRVSLSFFDSNDSSLGVVDTSTIGNGDLDVTFTIPNGTDYIDMRFARNDATAHEVEYTNVQIEPGTTKSTYEEYKSNVSFIVDKKLRSVPSAYDEISEENGSIIQTNKVEGYTLQSGDIEELDTANINYDYIKTKQAVDTDYSDIRTEGNSTTFNWGLVEGFNIESNAFDISNDDSVEYAKGLSISGRFFLTFPKGTYADLASAQSDLEGTKLNYEIAEYETINLTEQGLVSGNLASFTDGRVINSGTSLITPYLEMKVPTNVASQREYMLENDRRQDKQINAKADKVQEDWIEPTLLNGWTNAGGTYANAGYYKNGISEVKFEGLIDSGTDTSGTIIFNLPVGYRPSSDKNFIVSGTDDLDSSIRVKSNGDVVCRSVSSTGLFLNGISFRAEG